MSEGAGYSMRGVDWTNRDSVIAFARRMGKGMTVIKTATGYGITHTERRDRWAHLPPGHVLHIT